MKKILIIVCSVILLSACQESLEERAAREAREVTESKCPMPIGDNMYLDSIVFDIPTLTQTQYFRFIGDADTDSVVVARVAIRADIREGRRVRNITQPPART